jgi:hypothetical protein
LNFLLIADDNSWIFCRRVAIDSSATPGVSAFSAQQRINPLQVLQARRKSHEVESPLQVLKIRRIFPAPERRIGRRCTESLRLAALDSSNVNVTAATVTSSASVDATNGALPISLCEVDVLYHHRQPLVYDPSLDRYVPPQSHHPKLNWRERIRSGLTVALIPVGVTDNYYRFIRWRILQRLVNANLHVLGTQSLIMGLGIKSLQSRLELSAALNWVLKDCLGKITRLVWASKMGRKFDSDAKRWRFRSALVFAAGNALEIVTYLSPRWFLVWATCANSLKQVSMLTSSSTRTALYNSFRDSRTSSQNIGDITAKGEAQIAIVDLLGILSGVTLSRFVTGTSAVRICALYVLLQASEIFCMYQQLRSVQYRVLNFERMYTVMERFCNAAREPPSFDADDATAPSPSSRSSVPTPSELAAIEPIFWPPRRLARRANAFGSLSRTYFSPDELEALRDMFRRERFLLVVGPNLKKQGGLRRIIDHLDVGLFHLSRDSTLRQENCHIVLHKDASNVDIVKSTLALTLLRRRLGGADELIPDKMRSRDCYPLIRDSYQEADRCFAKLLREMSKRGWESPARSMFGRVHMRADWPLSQARAAAAAVTAEKSA